MWPSTLSYFKKLLSQSTSTHAWQNCIDVSALPTDKRTQVTQALNWLEKYFPEFNEMMWDIQQGQKTGTLKKINIRLADASKFEDTRSYTDVGRLDLDFKPDPYLGLDNKAHDFSLNEILAHELEHFAQTARGDDKSWDQADEPVRLKLASSYKKLSDYLQTKGVNEKSVYDYIDYNLYAQPEDKSKINLKIINDPHYKKLAQDHLNAYMARKDISIKYAEDGAVDRTNILHQLLGKPPRGSYFDYEGSGLGDELDKIAGNTPLTVYTTETPEAIRAQGTKSWSLSKDVKAGPMFHRQAATLSNDLTGPQTAWNNKWNADTKNITSEEWRIIEEAKAKLFSTESLKTMTPEKKKEADELVERLKKNFNQSNKNDVLSQANSNALQGHGLAASADKAKQSGWHLK